MRSVLLLACGLVACSSNESGFVAKSHSGGTGGAGGTGALFGSGGATGCTKDPDCKGVGVCEKGECVEPSATGGSSGQSGVTGGRNMTDASTAGTSGGGNGGGPATGGSIGTGGGGATSTGGSGGTSGDSGAGGTTGNLCPLAMFIMQDRSGSMVTGTPPPASPESWNNSVQAITAFVQDPKTSGIDIGLGTFPVGVGNTAACDGSDCGTPVVPIAALPGNATPMIQAMQQQTPNGVGLTPTECGLRGMINQCLTFMTSSPNGENCVAVLVTDGSPTLCDTNLANLTQIVSEGHASGVTTFTLGLPGADLNFLNGLATAGGTGTAIDVSGGAQALVAALNSVRTRSTSGQCN